MNSLRSIIISKTLSRKIHQISFHSRKKSTITTSTTSTNTTNTTKSSTEPFTNSTNSTQNENITVWNVYGPPFVNCFLIGSITYIGLHVLWYKLAFIELKEEMENKINELENKIDSLKKK